MNGRERALNTPAFKDIDRIPIDLRMLPAA